MPESEKICTGRDLAQVLAQIELPDGEAKIWRDELRASRKILRAPVSKWP